MIVNAENPGAASTSSIMEELKCSTYEDDLPCSEYDGSKNMDVFDITQPLMTDYFDKSVCSVCKNKRPTINWQLRKFSYFELHEATEGFSQQNYLSEGGFGFVFKGTLKDGMEIAVKQYKAASSQGEKEFCSELEVLSQARHQNVVMLLGSCTEGNHRLLVYEYVCNGSLEQHLTGTSSIIH